MRRTKPSGLITPGVFVTLLFGTAGTVLAQTSADTAATPIQTPDASTSIRDESPAKRAFEPLPIRDQRPYNLLFLQFTPEGSDVLPARSHRWNAQLDIANNLLRPAQRFGPPNVLEDNETQRLLGAYRTGLGRGWELGAFVPIIWRNSGILDPVLSAYHAFFGIPGGTDNPQGRGSAGQFHSLLQVTNAQGNLQVNQGNAFGLGDVSLTLKHGLLPSTRRGGLSARIGLKLPTGSENSYLGSGNADIGLSLDGRYNLGRDIVLYANLGGVLMGRAPGIYGARESMLQGFYAIEYRPNSRDRFLLQGDGNSRTVRTGNRFADREQVTFTFGYKRVLDAHRLLYLSLSENGDFANYKTRLIANVGPDVTISAGLEWRP